MSPEVAEPAGSLPRIERPSQAHALRFARELVERGERIDMQTLAAQLGVGRTTLYRWVGDREHLIAEVFAQLTDELFALCAEDAKGRGLDRALDAIRRFMKLTAGFEPLREFAQREPAVALRILVRPDGLVQQRIRAGVTMALEHNLPTGRNKFSAETIDVLVQVGAALEWTPIVVGDEPDIDRALHLGRTVLEADLASR